MNPKGEVNSRAGAQIQARLYLRSAEVIEDHAAVAEHLDAVMQLSEKPNAPLQVNLDGMRVQVAWHRLRALRDAGDNKTADKLLRDLSELPDAGFGCTDSGGFQVMSLSERRKVDDKGVTFRSHIDGGMVELTPERAIEVQTLLGADIRMQLDECIALPAERGELERAMRLSLRWAERCKRAFGGHAGPGAVRHRPGRRRSRCCARERARRWSTSASTATPSAGLRSASRRR